MSIVEEAEAKFITDRRTYNAASNDSDDERELEMRLQKSQPMPDLPSDALIHALPSDPEHVPMKTVEVEIENKVENGPAESKFGEPVKGPSKRRNSSMKSGQSEEVVSRSIFDKIDENKPTSSNGGEDNDNKANTNMGTTLIGGTRNRSKTEGARTARRRREVKERNYKDKCIDGLYSFPRFQLLMHLFHGEKKFNPKIKNKKTLTDDSRYTSNIAHAANALEDTP
ncbi:hypothetical protein RFI_05541, partial [Reticulomyxa filosa]